MSTRPDVPDLHERVLAGDPRALARMLTLVEDADEPVLRRIAALVAGATPTVRVIGVTGPPGVGKSSLTNALVTELRARQRRVGVVAVDPSSPFSGGALLGDRVRMQEHHADPGVFIRSMAARGHLGGCAIATPHAVRLLGAAGFSDVIVETVGVGQSEVEVAATADATLVVLAPGMGDGIQAAKAGILEVADVYVVNKADQPGADRLEADLRGMIETGQVVGRDRRPGMPDSAPPVMRTVAVHGDGVRELLDTVDGHVDGLAGSGALEERRRDRELQALREVALQRLRQQLGAPEVVERLEELAGRVAAGQLDVYAAVDELLDDQGSIPR